VRNFQHTLDLTAQLLTVQLKLKVKLYVCGAPYGDFKGTAQSPLQDFLFQICLLYFGNYSASGEQKLVRFSCEVFSPVRCKSKLASVDKL